MSATTRPATPTRAETDLGAPGQARVGVAGRVVALIALGLDDRAAAAPVAQLAPDQVAGHGVHGAGEEVRVEPLDRGGAHGRSASTRSAAAASACRARSIWSASAVAPVPPSIRFESSAFWRRSTS